MHTHKQASERRRVPNVGERSSSARQCRAMSKVCEPHALKMRTRWPLSAEAAERCPSPRAGIAKRGTKRAPEQPRANTAECRRTKAADCQSWPNVGPDGIHGSVLLERSTNECGKRRAHRAEELTEHQAYRAAERRTGYQSGRAAEHIKRRAHQAPSMPSTPSIEILSTSVAGRRASRLASAGMAY